MVMKLEMVHGLGILSKELLIMGKYYGERVNNDSQMGFYHDVAIGKLNEDNYLDIIGVGFNVFLGNENGQFDFNWS